jgi:hypothetical protein
MSIKIACKSSVAKIVIIMLFLKVMLIMYVKRIIFKICDYICYQSKK